ncbi:MAG: M48 family metallopeptidase [Candidatus Komeilibacteria bacterium]
MYSQIDSNKRKTWALMLIFVLVISLLGYVFNMWYGDSSYGILIIAVIFSLLGATFSYYSGDKVALASAGAKQIQKMDNPYVYRMVENLCITSGLPAPKVHIIPDDSINAFATGRDPEHASIAITTGAIDKLTNEELEGVIAHELSHIKNYDIRLMMIVIICIGIITLLADWMIRARLYGIGGKKSNDSNSGQLGSIILIVGLILAILSPIFARLIQFAVSRKREYLADASGAMLTRYPEGLANALEKIKLQNKPLKKVNKATAHLYISSPFLGAKRGLRKAFATHPDIDDRIAKLRNMA